METIAIRGIKHAYSLTSPSITPSSPVLVFIHGWLLSRQYWQPILEQLFPRYQCLTYDLRGFGDSTSSALNREKNGDESATVALARHSPAAPEYNLAAYARDLQTLLQKLRINQAWLIGHSLGGSIALWAADYCPQAVRGVICLNSGGGIYLKEEFERFRAAGCQLVKRRPRWLPYVPLIDLAFARAMVSNPLSRRWGNQRVIDFVKAEEQAALGALLYSTTESEVHLLPQVVSRLQQPVYFLAGAKDKVMEPKYVSHLASFHSLFNCNGDNVFEIPDCGHLSMVEQPEVVGLKIYQILAKHEL